MPVAILSALRWIGAFSLFQFAGDVAAFFGDMYTNFFGDDRRPTPMVLGSIALPLLIGVIIVGIIIFLLLKPLKKLV